MFINKTYVLAGVSWLLAGFLALSLIVNYGNKKPMSVTGAVVITASGGLGLVFFSMYMGLEKAGETCVFNCENKNDH